MLFFLSLFGCCCCFFYYASSLHTKSACIVGLLAKLFYTRNSMYKLPCLCWRHDLLVFSNLRDMTHVTWTFLTFFFKIFKRRENIFSKKKIWMFFPITSLQGSSVQCKHGYHHPAFLFHLNKKIYIILIMSYSSAYYI